MIFFGCLAGWAAGGDAVVVGFEHGLEVVEVVTSGAVGAESVDVVDNVSAGPVDEWQFRALVAFAVRIERQLSCAGAAPAAGAVGVGAVGVFHRLRGRELNSVLRRMRPAWCRSTTSRCEGVSFPGQVGVGTISRGVARPGESGRAPHAARTGRSDRLAKSAAPPEQARL